LKNKNKGYQFKMRQLIDSRSHDPAWEYIDQRSALRNAKTLK